MCYLFYPLLEEASKATAGADGTLVVLPTAPFDNDSTPVSRQTPDAVLVNSWHFILVQLGAVGANHTGQSP